MAKKGKEKDSESVHIEQLVAGFIQFGDAGIDKKRKDEGYVCHLCSMDNDSRFVDLALKKEHLIQIIKGAEEMLAAIEGKEKAKAGQKT